MKRTGFKLLSVFIVVLMLAAPISALAAPGQGPAPDQAPAGTGVYIVMLAGEPLSSYRGGLPGLAATNPAARGENKLDANNAASRAYRAYLAEQQAQFIALMEYGLSRPVEVLFQYDVAFNGLAVRLSPQEAAQVVAIPGVLNVQEETIEYPVTDTGPTWIGAPGIWNGSSVPGGVGSYGEGVIVGVIDTGINSDHASFADVGGDGYNHTNPWGSGTYVGYCVANPGFCNDKLIGAWTFVTEAITPEDSDGHGSHTASTSAGNFVDVSEVTPSGYVIETTISGVAPHANIIMYDACIASCPGSALLASVNQAVADGVDVINYSISGGTNPYNDSVELAFLAATDAGVFVSTSAGNAGPAAATVAHRSPWVTTVAASTHNKLFVNGLVSMSGGTTPAPANISGQSVSTGVGPRPIVYAGNYGDPLCGTPFPAGTWTNEIVVCDRGTYGRVLKGENVLAGGADGYVLANDAPSGNSLVADPHALPAIHITYNDGLLLKAWLASGSGHTATITPTSIDTNSNNGDIMGSFSSRGPNTTFDVLKPDVTAPGVAIYAAYMNGVEYTFLGGTSMSSPHTAGAGALLTAVHPDWTPSEIKSALMTTANITNLRKEDGTTPATPFDVGAGRDDLTQAARAGILLDESLANYQAANPALGGDPKSLNVPSLTNSNCEGTCTWTRQVKSTQSSAVTWTAGSVVPAGITLTVTPSSFSLPAGGTQTIEISADVSGAAIGAWAFALVTLTPSNGAIPTAHLPVSVIAQPGDTPPDITVDPASIETHQAVDLVQTYPLVIGNAGDAQLDWTIFEDNSGAGRMLVNWADNFDTYATNLSLHGVGGWKGWGNDPSATAYTRSTYARSAPNSVEIVNFNDLVHEYSGYTSGQWVYTAWQYIPVGSTGESYFILLNQYFDSGGTNNWSTQVNFNSNSNLVINDGPAGGAMPLVKGQWMEIRVEIDLDADIQRFYYGGTLLFSGSWSGGMSGGGITSITAVDLWGNGASAVYYDDLSLVEDVAGPCAAPSDIPWASVDPTSGSVPGGSSTTVGVSINTSGLTVGEVYAGNLCVASNDPVTPLVAVPVAVTVTIGPPEISLEPASLDLVQGVDTVATHALEIGNTGLSDLNWNIFEDNSGINQTLVNWADNFDTYATNLSLHGVGGWKGWGNDPSATAYTRSTYARSAPNSVEIVNFNDLVHEYSGYTSGQWVYTAWQYVPAGTTGESYFILLNQYDDPGATTSWSTQVNFNLGTSQISNDGPAGGALPLVKGQWMEIRVEIDLDADTQSFYYGGDLLFSGSWSNGMGEAGLVQFAAVDLWGNGASAIYYDDLSLVEDVAGPCELPSDIPWASVSPDAGTTLPGAVSAVDVTIDTTGMLVGEVYSANLCVASNDPFNPLVIVPLSVTGAEWGVELSPPAQTLSGAVGETVTHTFTLTNTGSAADNFALSVSGNAWPTEVMAETGLLDPGEAILVEVAVTIPASQGRAVPVDSDTFVLTAVSLADPSVMATAEGTTIAEAAPGVSLGANQAQAGSAGEQVAYVFTLTNLGDYADTFNLALSGAEWTTTLSITTTGEIAPGATVTITVLVDIPAEAAGGDFDVVTLTATSALDPAVSASVTATTTVKGYVLFMPLILNGH